MSGKEALLESLQADVAAIVRAHLIALPEGSVQLLMGVVRTALLSAFDEGGREARKADLVKEVEQPTESAEKVLVRSYGSGVHYGTLVSHTNTQARLSGARRIWYWTGANTLNEIALRGCAAGSKISEAVPQIDITGVLEIIPLTTIATATLDTLGWEK